MRDPRLVNPPPQFRDQLVAPSTLPLSARSATSPPLAAATTYLTSREQHAHPHFDPRAPHPQYDGLRDNRSRHAQAPSPVRWAHPPSRWQDQPPPPPPPVHRVYILRCATCDTFLSDRGMRAVLLLKPNIVLFSTDAAPCNSSAIWPDPTSQEPSAERTCDCLTSSLACHGCGSTVGYHIVQPCARCTASVQKHQRSANHHRFVFHHDQVVFSERRCVAGEAGVLQTAPMRAHSPSPSSCGSSPSPSSSPEAHAARDHKDGPPAAPLADQLRIPSRAEVARQASPAPTSRKEGLAHGDVVYWHHLVSGGERAEPIDPLTRPYSMPERAGR